MGWTRTGRFPPLVFIRNKKMPRTVVFRWGGETETSVTNRIPNQVSARINNDNIKWKYDKVARYSK